MALLRACADAVLIGAGTLRATPGHLWTPDHVYPALKSEFSELRRRLGRKSQPHLIVLSASGNVDVKHPGLSVGATIITTAGGAAGIKARLPTSTDVIQADIGDALTEFETRGWNVVLTEGGPHVIGELMRRGLLDEAFLTISPVLAGRDGEARLGMVAGLELLPERGLWSRLMSIRRHHDFVFLRYGLK